MELFEGVKAIVELGTVAIVLFLFMQYRSDKKEQDKVYQGMLEKKEEHTALLNKDLLDAYKENTKANTIQAEALRTLSANVQENTKVMATFTERFSNALGNR